MILGASSQYAEAVAAYPPIPKAIVAALKSTAGLTPASAALALKVLDVLEKGLDVVGFLAGALVVYHTREYVMEHRAGEKEKAERRAQASKAD